MPPEMLDVEINLTIRAVKQERDGIDLVRLLIDTRYSQILKADKEDWIRVQAGLGAHEMYSDTGYAYVIPLAKQNPRYYKAFAEKCAKFELLSTYVPWRHDKLNPVYAEANGMSAPCDCHEGRNIGNNAYVCSLTNFWGLQDECEDVMHQMFWLLVDAVVEKSQVNAQEWADAKDYETVLTEKLSVNFQIPNPAYKK